MAKAIVSRGFDATDTTKGVSVRVEAAEQPQTLPVWVIEAGEAIGAATRADLTTTTAEAAKKDSDNGTA